MYSCYLCNTKTSKIDDLDAYATMNYYYIDSGWISKGTEIIFCKNCNIGVRALMRGFFGLNRDLTDEGKKYLIKNKTKIINYVEEEKKKKEKLQNDIVTLLENKAVKIW